MKALSIFSLGGYYHRGLTNFVFVIISINICSVSATEPSTKSPENEFDGGIITSVNNTSTEKINTFVGGIEAIPTWIARQSSSSSPPTTTPTSSSTTPSPSIRARTTKVLEKPLDSQLTISHFPESFNERKNFQGIPSSSNDSHYHVNSSSTPATTSKPSSPSPTNSSEKRKRLLRRKYLQTPVPIPSIKKRQDITETFILPPSEIDFTSIVSPIEGSLGGLTGLQGLPPLSPIQFVKLLVSVTPFIIPLIFIPLLIFTIGLLMIPVTRANVFVDVGDLRSPSPSFISSYLINPIKSLSQAGPSQALMAIPRSLVNDLGPKLVDTEQCVERISCEISQRYLHPKWETGNWRSAANPGWISRIINYLWQRNPTVSRIAKSLDIVGDEMTAKEKGRFLLQEDGNNVMRSSGELCRRYTCQPKTLLQKFLGISYKSTFPSKKSIEKEDEKKD